MSVRVERLESRVLFNINDYVLAFTSGINLLNTGGGDDQRGGIFVMKADGSDMRQITTFSTRNFEFSGDGLNLPDDHPSFSPDGKKIVFTSSRAAGPFIVSPNNFDIYTMDANGANVKRLTNNTALDTEPAFSPDGTKIAFSSTRSGGDEDLWVMNADGTNPVQLTSFGNDDETEPAWSHDGTKIAFTRVTFNGVLGVLGAQKDLWVMNADGSSPRQLTSLFNEEHDPSWSPDDTRIAITSERGDIVFHKRPFGETVIVRASDGAELSRPTEDFDFSAGDPNWSPDGTKLAVFKADLPILTGPLVIYTMNVDGSDKRRIQAPGIISVHPSWGLKVDSDHDGRPDYLENSNFTFDQNAIIDMSESGDLLGAAEALPDLNHDGFLDLASGVPGENVLGSVDAGRVLLLPGSKFGLDFSFSVGTVLPPEVTGVLFGQSQAGGHFGQTLAAGDFNGDGFKDLAIGAPGANRIFIMYGRTGPFQQIAGPTGEFGAAMAVGDFNKDGKNDLAVGSPGEFRTTASRPFAAGAVRIFFGASGGLSTSPQVLDQNSLPATDAGQAESGDRFGASLAAGDLNGDFVDDLAIGSPGEGINGIAGAGMVQVVGGRSAQQMNAGGAVARDGRNLPSPFTGLQNGAGFGETLAMGNFNDNIFGLRELVVGTPGEDISGVVDAGLIALFAAGLSTGALVLPATGEAFSAQSVGGALQTLRFGKTLAVGDMTGDLVDDLAVAAPDQSSQGFARAGVIYLIPGLRNNISGTTTFTGGSDLLNNNFNISTPFGSGGGLALASAQIIAPTHAQATAGTDDHFGASTVLSSANALVSGDIDKDGQDELIIGSPEHDVSSALNAGQVSIRYGIKVGTSKVSPANATLPSSGKITYSVEWTHPRNWHDLTTVQFRIVNDAGVLAWVKFDEASNTLALLDPKTGQFSHVGSPGSNVKLQSGDVQLDLLNSAIIGTGATGRKVTLKLALNLGKKAANGAKRFRIEVFASDDNGNSQGFEQATTLSVAATPGKPGAPPDTSKPHEDKHKKDKKDKKHKNKHHAIEQVEND